MKNQNKLTGNHIDYFAPKILMGIVFILSLVLVVSATILWDSQNSLQKDMSVALTPVHELSRPGTKTTVPANWKTYTNSESGLQVSYPRNLELTESQGGFRLQNFSNADDEYSFAQNEYAIEVAFDSAFDKASLDEFSNVKEIDLNGDKGYEADDTGARISPYGPHVIFLLKPNTNYAAQIANYSSSNTQESSEINQILSTIKFTTSTSSDCLTRGECMLNNQ